MLAFTSDLQALFSTEISSYKYCVLHLVGQTKCVSSEPLDIASSCKILEMLHVFAKQRFVYFRFLLCKKNMSIGSRACVFFQIFGF
jgi:hypothetical protein